MRRLPLLSLILTLAGWACSSAPDGTAASQASPETSAATTVAEPPAHRQMLVVLTSNWDDPRGELYRLTWEAGAWRREGAPTPVLIGKKGLGWGVGLTDYTRRKGPVKQEGDLKSPAGLFALGTAFGYADRAEAKFVRMPYTPVVSATMCIEDTRSTYYNRIIDETQTEADWSSTDHMLRQDDLYAWGMLVEHNYTPAQPGGGSCIFLHVWNPEGSGTAGCTSMPIDRMKALLAWLDPAAAPLLLQVPEGEYAHFRNEWNLPEKQSYE